GPRALAAPRGGGGGARVGAEEREPVEVPEAADHVVADGLPLRIADGRRVLVLEETRALGILAIDAVPRALPLPAHLAHRALDQRRLRQGAAAQPPRHPA